jgi:hypothetical protein
MEYTNKERIREIEQRIAELEKIVVEQAGRQTRPSQTSSEMNELERLRKELESRKQIDGDTQ